MTILDSCYSLESLSSFEMIDGGNVLYSATPDTSYSYDFKDLINKHIKLIAHENNIFTIDFNAGVKRTVLVKSNACTWIEISPAQTFNFFSVCVITSNHEIAELEINDIYNNY